MRDHILVIGGYGRVGRTICSELAPLYPGKVVAAGRNLERAERFGRETEGRVRPLRIDMEQELDPEALAGVKLAIVCMDQRHPSFVQACLRQGVHYLDISADYRFLSQVESLHDLAASCGATAVLSVGLAPGLTNLLASQAKRMLDVTDAIHISVMLGLGDSHGRAAIEWTVEHLRSGFIVQEGGKQIQIAGFRDGRRTDFGGRLGKRTAYRFNFADQHSLPRTLQVPVVATRLCFDSSAVTGALAAAMRMGAHRLLNAGRIRDAVIDGFSSVRIGEPRFALKVDAIGTVRNKDALAECFLHGTHEADVTAKVAAAAADMLYGSDLPRGVFHIDQLYAYEDFDRALNGLAVMSKRCSVG
ncbi:saccharopine dehydrogenase family protein [Paenibacillus sp. GYB003]|uniref:saccharopine dehydrogenase family protein n=1 Tax=Paenibacillus sp. GYB003 TaxID=2994392 RepID=UPI002F96A0E0